MNEDLQRIISFKGVVKMVSHRGYGFFIPDEDDTIDVFFSAADFYGAPFDEIEVGTRIQCEKIITNSRGYQAKVVRLDD